MMTLRSEGVGMNVIVNVWWPPRACVRADHWSARREAPAI